AAPEIHQTQEQETQEAPQQNQGPEDS
ncbi:hypothetical protein LCGC14_1319980, partial [marine sediment metagenome]